MLVFRALPRLAKSVRDNGIASGLKRSAPVVWRWPSAKGQAQTSIQARGMANALMRFGTSDPECPDPAARLYVNSLPAFFRRMPGLASETSLRSADLAAFLDRQLPARYQTKSTSIKATSIYPKKQAGLCQRLSIKPRASDLASFCHSDVARAQQAGHGRAF
jgi:hypothetical protein